MNLPPSLIPNTSNPSVSNTHLFILTPTQTNILKDNATYIKCKKCNQIPFTLITSINTVSLTCSCKRDTISINNVFKIINNTLLYDTSNIFEIETYKRLTTTNVCSYASSTFIKCNTHPPHLNNIFCKQCQHYHCIKCIDTVHKDNNNNNVHTSFSTETYLNITAMTKHIVYETEQRIINVNKTEQPLPLHMQFLRKLISLFHIQQDNTLFINVIQNCKYSYTNPYLCEISTITIDTCKQSSIDVIAFNKKYNHLISASSAVTNGNAVYIYQLHSFQYTSQLIQVISLNDINEYTNTAVTAVFVDENNFNLLIAKLSIHVWTFNTNVNKYIHHKEVNVHNNIVFQVISLLSRKQIASCSMDGSVVLYNNNYEYIQVITPNNDECVNAIAYDNKRNVLYMSLPGCNEVYSVELKKHADVKSVFPEISSEFTNGFKLLNNDVLGIARNNSVHLYDIIHQQHINEYKCEHDVNCILNVSSITRNNEVIYGCDNGNIILTNTKHTKHHLIQLLFLKNDNDDDHNDNIDIVSICVLSNGLLAFACGNGVIHLCTY